MKHMILHYESDMNKTLEERIEKLIRAKRATAYQIKLADDDLLKKRLPQIAAILRKQNLEMISNEINQTLHLLEFQLLRLNGIKTDYKV